MIIRGTSKIRGALDLSVIGVQITRDEARSIPNSDFWKTDVQRALSAGFIVSENETTKVIDEDQDDQALPVRCLNSYSRPLNILKRQDQIHPGKEFILTRAELSTPEIQAAIAKGMITIVNATANDNQFDEIQETTISVSKIIEKQEAQLKNEERESQFEHQNRRPALDLDTNDELDTPQVISHRPSSTSTETDKRKKTVIWNPTGAKEGNTMERAVVATSSHTKPVDQPTTTSSVADNVIDTDNPAPVNPNQHDMKKMSFVVQPKNNEVEFVDQKAEQARREAHPVLKDKAVKIKDDVSFIDPDEDRRQKHPVLKDQPQDHEEDDVFV